MFVIQNHLGKRDSKIRQKYIETNMKEKNLPIVVCRCNSRSASASCSEPKDSSLSEWNLSRAAKKKKMKKIKFIIFWLLSSFIECVGFEVMQLHWLLYWWTDAIILFQRENLFNSRFRIFFICKQIEMSIYPDNSLCLTVKRWLLNFKNSYRKENDNFYLDMTLFISCSIDSSLWGFCVFFLLSSSIC